MEGCKYILQLSSNKNVPLTLDVGHCVLKMSSCYLNSRPSSTESMPWVALCPRIHSWTRAQEPRAGVSAAHKLQQTPGGFWQEVQHQPVLLVRARTLKQCLELRQLVVYMGLHGQLCKWSTMCSSWVVCRDPATEKQVSGLSLDIFLFV